MNPKNRLYTKSYFLKRLRDENIICRSVDVRFANDDDRKWMIVVDPEKTTLVITCFKKSPADFHFKVSTSRAETRIKTESMECVISLLNGMLKENQTSSSSPLTTDK